MEPWDIYPDLWGWRRGTYQFASIWKDRSSKWSDMTGIPCGRCKTVSFYSKSHSTNNMFYKKKRKLGYVLWSELIARSLGTLGVQNSTDKKNGHWLWTETPYRGDFSSMQGCIESYLVIVLFRAYVLLRKYWDAKQIILLNPSLWETMDFSQQLY